MKHKGTSHLEQINIPHVNFLLILALSRYIFHSYTMKGLKNSELNSSKLGVEGLIRQTISPSKFSLFLSWHYLDEINKDKVNLLTFYLFKVFHFFFLNSKVLGAAQFVSQLLFFFGCCCLI